jgi:uncharacterized protein YjbJ (UPF0337 family)
LELIEPQNYTINLLTFCNSINMSDKDTSTLQSYIDTTKGAIQSTFGNLTGNTTDQEAGAAKQEKAQVENDASHATAKLGGYTASADGVITKDDPNRSGGSWNQTIGSGKEAVGNLFGLEVGSLIYLRHQNSQIAFPSFTCLL